MKEEKICSFTQKGKRIQLLKITNYNISNPREYIKGKPADHYEIRINRKIETRCTWEGEAKRRMATILTNELLQQKFTF